MEITRKDTVEVEVLECLVCDMCGAKTTEDYWGEWYDHMEVIVQAAESGRESCENMTGFDLCPKCFFEKLVPFIKAAAKRSEEKAK